jgi:hypothetical protein
MAVSVIIPTLNEAACIQETIRSLRRQGADEIIVVDGGSTDGTHELAREADAMLISPPGRALQMHAGALDSPLPRTRGRGVAGEGVEVAEALAPSPQPLSPEYRGEGLLRRLQTSDSLLFLHADCTLEDGALAAIERCLRQPRVIAGCFSLRVQQSGWLYRAIDWCATARVKLTGFVYGDQGLFMRRTDYLRLGGFPPLSFMEDVMFSKTLRRHGRIVVLPHKILVSPRRWQKTGILRQTLRNWTLTALAASGIHPDRLAKFYPGVR